MSPRETGVTKFQVNVASNLDKIVPESWRFGRSKREKERDRIPICSCHSPTRTLRLLTLRRWFSRVSAFRFGHRLVKVDLRPRGRERAKSPKFIIHQSHVYKRSQVQSSSAVRDDSDRVLCVYPDCLFVCLNIVSFSHLLLSPSRAWYLSAACNYLSIIPRCERRRKNDAIPLQKESIVYICCIVSACTRLMLNCSLSIVFPNHTYDRWQILIEREFAGDCF